MVRENSKSGNNYSRRITFFNIRFLEYTVWQILRSHARDIIRSWTDEKVRKCAAAPRARNV